MFDYKNRSVGQHILWAIILMFGMYFFLNDALTESNWYWLGVPFVLFSLICNIIDAVRKIKNKKHNENTIL